MDEPVRCLDEGLLAGTHLAFPAEDLAWQVRERPVPCGRLRCADCGEAVRHVDGYALLAPPSGRAACEALFAALGGTGDLPGLTRAGAGVTSRTWACRCDACSVGGVKTLRYGGPDGWSCAGHAAAQR